MRLPQPLLDSPFFLFERLVELERAIGEFGHDDEIEEVRRLVMLGLPPVASPTVLATMLGINEGLVWSFVHRPRKHYRIFNIAKGRGRREIQAPRVALKVPQKWIAGRLAAFYVAPRHVFGFVPNRSHIGAANVHRGANWVLSLDLENFFPTTPELLVKSTLAQLGYAEKACELIASLACLNGVLAQGAPTSPVISNLCFSPWDRALALLAEQQGVKLTRYADDIVFSGTADYPEGLKEQVAALLESSPWRLSEQKAKLEIAPARRKVHGLVVHGGRVRLTKGYRNRIRAYRHLLTTRNDLDRKFVEMASGHLAYSDSVDAAT